MIKLRQLSTRLIVLLCLAGLNHSWAKAQHRSEQEALQIAQSFLQKPQVSNETFRSASLQSKSNYYIINDGDGEGFALISAHSSLTPLIAYSSTSQIAEQGEGKLPEGLRYFLSAYDDYARAKQEELRGTVANERYRRDFYYPVPVVAPLIDSRWGQYAPFNNECPKINGQLPPAGCVAVALGQIMYKHKYPTNPTGSYSYTLKATGQKLSRDFSLSEYDWDLFLPTYPDKADKSKEAKSIARLMADLGIAVRMNYELSGSGALTRRASWALEQYFDYQTQVIEARELSQGDFIKCIKNELDGAFPVYMEGTNTQGGAHAWVIDGYDNSGLLHINWGWSGMSDGYFDLRVLNPAKKGAEFSSGLNSGFNRNVAILVMHPKKEGVAPIKALASILNIASEGFFKPKAMKRKDKFNTSEDFIVSLQGIENKTGKSFTARCAIGLFDSEGKRLKLFKPQLDNAYERFYQARIAHVSPLDFACDLKGLAEGKYELRPILQLVSDQSTTGEWTNFRGSKPIVLEVLATGEVQVLDYTDEAVRLLSARQPEEMAVSKIGQEGRISLRLENPSYSRAWGKLQMLFYKQNQETKEAEGDVLEKLTVAELRLAPLEVFDGDVRYKSNLPAGKYIVKFQLKEESNLYQDVELEGKKQLALELYDASNRAWLELSSLGCYKDNNVFRSDFIDLDKDSELGIGCRLANVSGLYTFSGKISFCLMDMADDKLISLCELKPTIRPSEEFSNFASIALFSPKAKGLKKGHTYRLVIKFQGKNDKEAIDLWTANAPRRYFTIIGEAEEKPIEEDKPKEQEEEKKPNTPASLGSLGEDSLRVYPIPFEQYLNIEGLNSYKLLKIYDLKGRLILQKFISSIGTLRLDLGTLPRGQYLLVLNASEEGRKEVIHLIK